MIKAMFLSDWHLGARRSSADLDNLFTIVKQYCPDKIYFIGDMADLIISHKNNKFFDELKIKFAKYNPVFVYGNHDEHCGEPLKTAYINNKWSMLIHGHQYDYRCDKWYSKPLIRMEDWFIRLTGWDIRRTIIAYFEKDIDGVEMVPELAVIKNEVIKCAYTYDLVFTGHTHYPEISKHHDLIYINCGNWHNFVIMDEKKISLYKILKSKDGIIRGYEVLKEMKY